MAMAAPKRQRYGIKLLRVCVVTAVLAVAAFVWARWF